MARKTTLECQDCVEKFTVSSSNPEPVAYCPFCGCESVSTPGGWDDDEDDEEQPSDDYDEE